MVCPILGACLRHMLEHGVDIVARHRRGLERAGTEALCKSVDDILGHTVPGRLGQVAFCTDDADRYIGLVIVQLPDPEARLQGGAAVTK